MTPVRDASVVSVGCGVMGLLNLAAARAFGAQRLIAIDPDPARRAAARAFGADAVHTPGDAAHLADTADIVIVGPGHPDVIRESLSHVRPDGVVLLFTPTPNGVATALDLGDLYFRDVSLIPSYSCGPEETRAAYALLRTGAVQPEPLITHRFPLEQVQVLITLTEGNNR
jgi:L-iditol 2-dehydrogenase